MAGAKELLRTYREKRDFAKTQEPAGGSTQKQVKDNALSFVVQKHDATRLHYDFRIELDGVLKSWAVTKGPSNNPADKRLAVHVEDHPLEYGGFEGTIPEGEYGGGTVMLWDEGTWEPIGDPHEGLEKGDLKMRIHGQRMKGEWVLVHMKGRDNKLKNGTVRENWLLIKHRDDYARDENDLTERFTKSVSTGRDFDGIAKGLKPKKKTETATKAVWHSDRSVEENTKAATAKPSASKKTPARSSKGGKLPDYQPPQLATLVDRVPSGAGWQFEMKYDGYRCLAAVSGGKVKLYTRNGKDWTEQFGKLVPAFEGLTDGSALIDGEICAFDDKGRTDFSTLKDALSNNGPLVFFAFDLLERDGQDLKKKPQNERRAALEELIGKTPRDSLIQLSTAIDGKGEEVFNALCKGGFEGVIAKKMDSPYRGDRTKSWLKIKCTHRQEFVICGWSPSTKSNAFASLVLGTMEDGKLIYRGRVGTGFSEDDRDAIYDKLKARERKTPPFDGPIPRDIKRRGHWVTPELVAEIAYTEVTPDGALRHPSFLGLREDKPSKDVHMDKPAGLPAEAKAGSKAKGKAQDKAKSSSRQGGAKMERIELTTEMGEAAAKNAGVRLTSPDKVLFPEQGVTKGELIAYYDQVAERMLTYLADRPLSLVRCPGGREKSCFFQKHDSGGFPEEFKRLPITEKSGESADYFYIDDKKGLFAGAQMNVLEFHIWGVKRDMIEKPERIIFDIDPDEGLDFGDVKKAAHDFRTRLKDLGLESFPMVTGGKGVHVIAPLQRRAEWPEVKTFCKGFAQTLADEEPERFVAVMSKARRKGRMFIDYLRNERGSTAIAPFSTRSRQGAPCAVPVSWEELDDLDAANQFTLEAAASRAQAPDPWKGYFDLKQSITKKMMDAVGA